MPWFDLPLDQLRDYRTDTVEPPDLDPWWRRRLDEARAAARRVPELEPGFTVSGFVRSHVGRAEIWEPIGEALRQLGLPE